MYPFNNSISSPNFNDYNEEEKSFRRFTYYKKKKKREVKNKNNEEENEKFESSFSLFKAKQLTLGLCLDVR
jgi:hypothetical protein